MKLIYKNRWSDAEVEAHWDQVADQYIDANNTIKDAHDQRFEKMISWLNLPDVGSVLNITSRDCEANDYINAAAPNLDVTNAEISAELMRVAGARRPYAKQVKLDNYSVLPFLDAAFDRICCLETLEHVSEPVVFLRELNRVCKADGVMVLSCPPHSCEWSYRLYTLLFGGHGEGPHRFLPSREVKQMLIESGWILLHHEGTLLLPAGPKALQIKAERFISKYQKIKFVAEMGIRQFYVCKKN